MPQFAVMGWSWCSQAMLLIIIEILMLVLFCYGNEISIKSCNKGKYHERANDPPARTVLSITPFMLCGIINYALSFAYIRSINSCEWFGTEANVGFGFSWAGLRLGWSAPCWAGQTLIYQQGSAQAVYPFFAKSDGSCISYFLPGTPIREKYYFSDRSEKILFQRSIVKSFRELSHIQIHDILLELLLVGSRFVWSDNNNKDCD